MSALDKIRADVAKYAPMVEPLIEFALLAQKATGLGGATAAEALSVIDAAIKALEKAAEGAISTAMVLAELDKLKAGLASNDAAADAALAAKFPATSTGGA